MADDLDNTIRENAQGPKRAAGESSAAASAAIAGVG